MSVDVGCRYCRLANGNENGCETRWCHFHDPERHAVLGPAGLANPRTGRKGSPSVAFLPHAEAAKLTMWASYW